MASLLSSRFTARTSNLSDNADRLPKNVKPVHYNIYIEPQLSIAKFIGTVIIELEVFEAATSISLNTLDIDIVDTEVQDDHGNVVGVKEVKYDKETSTSVFVLSETLPASSKARIQLNFTGRMDAQAVGFFRSSYTLDGVTKYIGSTQMQPVDCRRVFPCFDEPALKATFKLTLLVDEELDCVGNMPISSVESDCGRKRVDFETTPLMSTYLVAFAVGKFNYVETEKDDFKVPVRVWATEDKRIEQGRFSLDLAVRALKAYETTFGLDYPLPKMDMMAIPGHRGGMENWGLVLYDESLLLVDEEKTSADAIRWIGKVVVHELAHQWFGNIVTMEFWNDIWLNESFADWASVYMYQSLNPEWKQAEEFVSGPLQEAFELDSDQETHPIEVPVRRAKDISEVFDAISYSKGCAVLLEISNYLGEKTFLKGVRRHLQLNKYGNAKAADLWKALSHASGQDVGKIMSTLTREAGYPIVTVRENESDGTISLEQHRFLANGATASWKEDVCYPVFLNILTASEVKDSYQLLRRTKTFKVPLDFYKLNYKQKGFYRVSYTPKRLRILAENIKEGLLSEQDRIGIISDVTALTSAKVYKTTTVLDLLYNFIGEESFFVWNQIFASLQHINHGWIFDDSGISESLSSFQKDLAYLVLKHNGWTFYKSDGIIEQRLKGLLFANAGGNPDVVKAAFELFEKYVAGEKNPINPNIREAVFAIVLQHGGSREYNAVLSGIYDAESLDERNTCLQSLGQARSPQLIQRTLKFALSDEIISRAETPKTIKSLSSHREGREALWEWLQTHWDEINQKVPRSIKTIEVFVQIFVAPLATRKHLEEVKAFFKDKDTTGYRLELSKALNTIQMMAEWAERDRDDVKKWFKAHGY